MSNVGRPPEGATPYGAPVILDDEDPTCSDSPYVRRARVHRRRLDSVRIVAITGSCGKTSTKDLAAAILRSRFRGSKSEDTKNCGLDLAATVLAADPGDDFLVQELGAWGPGTLDAGIEFVRPEIAVITNLRNDHFSTLHGPLGAQAEKGKLVRSLTTAGTAILNWDDPLVRELSSWTPARVISFGTSEEAELRASRVSATWPRTLSFDVTYQSKTVAVRTQLLGRHLLGSALGAIGVGLVFGMSLADCSEVLAATPPTFRRMSPVRHPDGVTFVRDDWKAPADSFPEVFQFIAEAIAHRKIVVVGQVSDFGGRSRPMYERIAADAKAVADVVVFVGARAAELWPSLCVTARECDFALPKRSWDSLDGPSGPVGDGDAGAEEQSLAPDPALPSVRETGEVLVFRTVREADIFLRRYLSSGDLVLLKGSGPADHLDRLILNREEPVGCWLERCGRVLPCHLCDLIRADSSPSPRPN